ncbi:phosphoenolpyruvate synthase [Tsukamurella sp. 1534]|uniref:phosphoenolpyruvate synthase n=1 Tax=Tsukamurella sp. 1534 TaxID=1151061 RepID=UPI0005954FEC|nr:phosphoenolpyruvate synthase [Tsukamurella sp. 1534]
MQVLGPWTDPETLGVLGGGKSHGLALLERSGLRVPEWSVVGTDAFDTLARDSGFAGLIEDFHSAAEESEAHEHAARIRAAIASAELPAPLRELIADAYRAVGEGAIAVRSSTTVEDGAEASYAGQFDTFLNVNGLDDVTDRVRRCWVSAFTERSVGYAFAAGRRPSGGVAVVLQRLVDAEVSGVVFTANPITGATDETVVSAVYGLGEGLVSGAVDADTVTVDAGGAAEVVVGEKATSFRPSGSAGAVQLPVADGARGECALPPDRVRELCSLARDLAAALGEPQDVEWAHDGTDFWFLQSRPITAIAPALPAAAEPDPALLLRGAGEPLAAGDARIWDNSNIIESFSGLTSPLTFTTAADIYSRVYRGYAASLRVPAAQLRQIDEWTPYMLGCFHSRVYYNLLHWYRMVGIAPGYPLNRKVLEAALGVSEPLDSGTAGALRPFTFDGPLQRLRSRLVTTATYARRLWTIDAVVADFLREFYRVYDDFEAVDLDAMSGAEAYEAYLRVEGDLVRRWGPLMVLDAVLLTLTGSMYALTKVLLPRAPEWFLYAVIGPGADVESAEPARAMTALAERAAADPALRSLIDTADPATIDAAVRSGAHEDFRAGLDDYLARYGYRSLDELKLEVPDLHEDPSSVYLMLRSGLARAADAPGVPGETAPVQTADEYLDAHLHGVRRRVYERLRGKVSRCAAHRERLRFCRTRAFGMVKRLIRVMGRDLAARGEIDDFRDVFELTIDELRDAYRAPEAGAGLRDRVAARRAARERDAGLVAPERFETRGPDLGDAELAAQGWVPVSDVAAAADGVVLRGSPSAGGIVEGRAVVMTEPGDVAGGVLVAYRTDPGWVAALPSASALVIERGSPLTHVAIVARELGVPTVVQLRGAAGAIRTGMRVRVDGTAGTVTVLSGGDDDA